MLSVPRAGFWSRPRNRAVIALVLANMALATGPLFVRMSDVGPVASAFWRIALAAPILLAIAVAVEGRKTVTSGMLLWLPLLLAGIAFAADLSSWHVGILHTTLANSTLFGNTATFIFPLYGFIVARAWPNKMQASALLLAAIGGGLLLGRSASLSADNFFGDLLCMLAGVFYAVYFVFMLRARERLGALSSLAFASFATVPPLLLLSWFLGEQIIPGNWGAVVILALVSQVFGQGCMIYALGHLSPLIIGIGLLIQPIVAAILGWLVFDERLTTLDMIGAALVAAALVLVRGGEVASTAKEPKSA